jgi:hypothetical protein
MNRRVPSTTGLLTDALLLFAAIPASAQLDVVSGASRGRNMVTVSAITTTTNTAALTYTEGYRNGTFRFYYTTTAFANAGDTTRSSVTKMNVTPRGSGTLNLSNLAANTKYYFRFQGYYPTGTANYWARGSFTTKTAAGLMDRRWIEGKSGAETFDAQGRPTAGATGVGFRPEGAVVQPRDTRR